ncbi:MAG: hypothetical protein HY900_13995 [Deltaproteobacteria bacterium]|nr:hypothetical protein [Deltaproteobacteria bacterium]
MSTNLVMSGRSLTGSLHGKSISCLLHPTSGQGPSPGSYVVRIVKDPVFGRLGYLAPGGASGVGAGGPQAYEFYCYSRPGGDGPSPSSSWVLSDRPIGGRNCLMATTGLPELLDALTEGGAAVVTVY